MLKLFNDAYYQNKYSCYGFGSDIGSGGGSGGQAEASGGAGGNTGGTGKQGGGGGTNDNLAGKIAAMNREAAEKAAAEKAEADRQNAIRAQNVLDQAQKQKDALAAEKKAAAEREKNEYGLGNMAASVFESVVSFFTGGIVNVEIDEKSLIGEPLAQGVHLGFPGVGTLGPTVGITEEGPTVNKGLVADAVTEFASNVTDDDPTNDWSVFESVVESVKKHSSTYTEEVADAPPSDPPDWRTSDSDGGGYLSKNNAAPTPAAPTPTPAAQIASNKGLLSQAAVQSQSSGKLSMANRFSPDYYTKEYL
jgi:hypothetical protein